MRLGRCERFTLGAALALLLYCMQAGAVRISDVRNSKHNLSATSSTATRSVVAVSETQICVFCHTPHGATRADQGGAAINGQLWNRSVPAASTYTGYTSSSLDAAAIQAGFTGQPAGSSKLCLSCHDGTIALGSVNALNGAGSAATPGTASISMSGGVTTLPGGSYGATSGYTKDLGTDLSNDHPISVTYDSTLATRDGELRALDANQQYPAGSGSIIGKGQKANHALLPLESTGAGGAGQIQCSACHDPHIVETDATQGNQKFLRTNRFQVAAPTASYNQSSDIICVACHDKNGATGAWAYSVHGNPLVATQTYTAGAVTPREFPPNLPVWKAACLNCHDTHTVQGAKHLLREGTDGAYVGGAPGAGGYKQGGNAALEQTCYQCHTSAVNSVITPMTGIDDIQTDFASARTMPITSAQQPAGSEVHDVGGNFNDATFVDCTTTANKCGADGVEQRSKLGVGAATNRHAECTDCHNPHRAVKFQRFYGAGGAINGAPDASATHPHTDTAGYVHDNIASGALRGAWGVEPTYTSRSFQSLPSGYQVKRGDPGANASTAVTQPYVTREYQICLKCHSDYGYSDNNVYPTGSRPNLGSYLGGTPANTNNLGQYTNQAKEFQAPATHQNCESPACNLGTDAGANSTYNTNNHRSWHPVLQPTGRTQAARRITIAGAFLNPWNTGQGTQTMYCSDCHGSNTTSTTSVIPDAGKSWGAHGSANNFLLKGQWDNSTGAGNASYSFCLKCHAASVYDGTDEASVTSGFYAPGRGQGHNFHRNQLGRLRCNWCHVAVPHGWKNKSLLVNLNDVGPEVGLAPGTNVGRGPYNRGPYYMNAYLKINRFEPSGQWSQDMSIDCDHGHGNPP